MLISWKEISPFQNYEAAALLSILLAIHFNILNFFVEYMFYKIYFKKNKPPVWTI